MKYETIRLMIEEWAGSLVLLVIMLGLLYGFFHFVDLSMKKKEANTLKVIQEQINLSVKKECLK